MVNPVAVRRRGLGESVYIAGRTLLITRPGGSSVAEGPNPKGLAARGPLRKTR